MNGAAAKTDMASPRWDAGNMSAMTPPAFVRGEEPKAPAKNRRMIRVWILSASSSCVEGRKDTVRGEEEDLPAIELGKRSPKQGPNGELRVN